MDDLWTIYGWCLNDLWIDLWMLYGRFMDAYGCFMDDLWMIYGWFLDDLWMVSE